MRRAAGQVEGVPVGVLGGVFHREGHHRADPGGGHGSDRQGQERPEGKALGPGHEQPDGDGGGDQQLQHLAAGSAAPGEPAIGADVLACAHQSGGAHHACPRLTRQRPVRERGEQQGVQGHRDDHQEQHRRGAAVLGGADPLQTGHGQGHGEADAERHEQRERGAQVLREEAVAPGPTDSRTGPAPSAPSGPSTPRAPSAPSAPSVPSVPSVPSREPSCRGGRVPAVLPGSSRGRSGHEGGSVRLAGLHRCAVPRRRS